MSDPLSIGRRQFLGMAAGASAAAVLGRAVGTTGSLTGFEGRPSETRRSSKATLNIPVAAAPWTPSYLKLLTSYEARTGNTVQTSTYQLPDLLTELVDDLVHRSNTYDVLFITSDQVGEFYNRGWVVPIAELDPSFTWPKGLIEYGGTCRWDRARKTTSLSGTPMLLPFEGNIQLLFYRRDIYDKLGLKVPETWDEVLANGQHAQKVGAVRYGYAIRGQASIGGFANTYDFSGILGSYGGHWFVDSAVGDYTPAVNDEHGQAAMEEWLRLATIGPAQPQTIGQPEIQSLMQSGQLLQAELVAASASSMDDPSQSSVVDKVDYAVLPAGPPPHGRHAPQAGIWALGVPTGLSKTRQRAAWEFISWMTSASSQVVFTEDGGVPTSLAVTRSGLTKDTPFRFMSAVNESAPYIQTGLTYPFTFEIAAITEPVISEIVARSLSVKAGLDKIAQGIAKIRKV